MMSSAATSSYPGKGDNPDKDSKQRIQLGLETCELEVLLDPPRIITIWGITSDRRVKRYDLKITLNQKLLIS